MYDCNQCFDVFNMHGMYELCNTGVSYNQKGALGNLILFCSLHFNDSVMSLLSLEIKQVLGKAAVIAMLILFCSSAAAGECFKEKGA